MPDMSQANMAEMSMLCLTAIAQIRLQKIMSIFVAHQKLLRVLQYPMTQPCMPINWRFSATRKTKVV